MLARVVPLIQALKTTKTTTSQRLSTMASANTAAPPWTPCKVALVQLRSARPDKQDNNAHMRAIVDQTVRDGKPDLIVLPVSACSSTGYLTSGRISRACDFRD